MAETLNIISESYNDRKIGGPYKVIVNTLKGLDRIGYPYVINKGLSNFRYNWVHDSSKGLIETVERKIPAVIGPNIAVLPKDLPPFIHRLDNCVYLHPSKWCLDVWKSLNFKACPLFSWPAGIDLDEFNINRKPDSTQNVMVYWKRRDPVLFNQTIIILRRLGFIPHVVKCGEYSEEYYKTVLGTTCFGIWLGTSESQGIALQEALASNLPLIVCDVQSLFEAHGNNDYKFPKKLIGFKPTSAPYFDKSCGILLNDFSSLEYAIKEITNNLSLYKPREYVSENLSLEKQANELLSFFEILKVRNHEYFQNPIDFEISDDFRVSLKGGLIFLIFIIRRKIRTLLRLIVNKIIA